MYHIAARAGRMEVLQLLFTLSEDYPGLNEEIIKSASLVIDKVSVCDGLYCSMRWGWLLLHGGGYCSMGVATAPWGWLLLHGGGYCSMGRATAPWG